MDRVECRRHFLTARVATLATVGEHGPHVVPIVFAASDDLVTFAVDHKPKQTRELARLGNIERDPRVSIITDHYDEDWRRLWWVRADGTARIASSGADFEKAISMLVARYEQYLATPPEGPAVLIDVSRWTGWSATEPQSDRSG